MSVHKSNLGCFGNQIKTDMDGYIPTADTGPWELSYDHGSESTHNDDGSLTEYGQWWETEGFTAIRATAIADVASAEEYIAAWNAE